MKKPTEFCSICGAFYLEDVGDWCTGHTCSPECARTKAIVEALGQLRADMSTAEFTKRFRRESSEEVPEMVPAITEPIAFVG